MCELDHLFLCTSVGAPEADKLVKFGLTEGSPNVHEGQGTANRRFFFHNAMLELLWVCNADEAQSDTVNRTQLWQRWSGARIESSPLGICLRPSSAVDTKPPFPAWAFRPRFLPEGRAIHIAADAPLAEPMWFFLGFGRRPDTVDSPRHEPHVHPIGFREITGVEIVVSTSEELSPAAQAVKQTEIINIATASEHMAVLTFDRKRSGGYHDFRPDLPLVFRW